uniref:Hpt domain-containing protein n=1 Tax=Trichloromonas sp. TaxID=3069249 RepID=UPI003D81C17E
NTKFRGIISRFVTRLHEQLAAMDAAAETDNFDELGRLGHWLKGAGGTVGFSVFTEPAIMLEQQAKSGSAQQLKETILLLRELANRIELAGEAAAAPRDAVLNGDARTAGAEGILTAAPAGPIVSRLAGNPRLHRTIRMFIARLEEKIVVMDQAVATENMAELASLAHWLKGAGGTVGFDDFTEPAASLEHLAKAGESAAAAAALEKVRALALAIAAPEGEKCDIEMTAG